MGCRVAGKLKIICAPVWFCICLFSRKFKKYEKGGKEGHY